jgi:hypothetical protein
MILRKILFVLFGLVGSAQAHPGHDPFSAGAKHFVTAPSHILPTIIFAGLLCGIAHVLKNRRDRTLVRFCAAIITLLALFS